MLDSHSSTFVETLGQLSGIVPKHHPRQRNRNLWQQALVQLRCMAQNLVQRQDNLFAGSSKAVGQLRHLPNLRPQCRLGDRTSAPLALAGNRLKSNRNDLSALFGQLLQRLTAQCIELACRTD